MASLMHTPDEGCCWRTEPDAQLANPATGQRRLAINGFAQSNDEGSLIAEN
jgi:hypothetical protein